MTTTSKTQLLKATAKHQIYIYASVNFILVTRKALVNFLKEIEKIQACTYEVTEYRIYISFQQYN